MTHISPSAFCVWSVLSTAVSISTNAVVVSHATLTGLTSTETPLSVRHLSLGTSMAFWSIQMFEVRVFLSQYLDQFAILFPAPCFFIPIGRIVNNRSGEWLFLSMRVLCKEIGISSSAKREVYLWSYYGYRMFNENSKKKTSHLSTGQSIFVLHQIFLIAICLLSTMLTIFLARWTNSAYSGAFKRIMTVSFNIKCILELNCIRCILEAVSVLTC